jgi:gamma-glutamyl:cysteine ligase YbdK (ATP-grasp superfamily)
VIRGRDILRLPVITRDTGDKLGHVEDLVIDRKGSRALGSAASALTPCTSIQSLPNTKPLGGHILDTLKKIEPYAVALDSKPMRAYVRGMLETGNDARWIRSRYRELRSFHALMAEQARRWSEHDEVFAV